MLSVHQKGAAEAFVWVNYKKGFKRQNRESSPWIASVGWTVCHSIKTIPRCFDKVCAYLSAGRLKESVCACLMRACECCCAVESQNKLCQWADKRKVPVCVRAANGAMWTHFGLIWWNIWRRQRKQASDDKLCCLQAFCSVTLLVHSNRVTIFYII